MGPPRLDADLVTRARTGDLEAMDELVRRHHAAVYRTALGILHDEDRAQDAAQEAFLKAMRGLSGFRGDARFLTWLLTITVNEARGMLRRVGRRQEQSLEHSGPLMAVDADPAEQATRGIEVARARACLARLPEKQRLAVSLRVFEGLSFREVGEAIDSSEGAARVNYHHGIRRLREMLE
jgi:RNA polymerase sigma-70 factor (ECF subfamily)